MGDSAEVTIKIEILSNRDNAIEFLQEAKGPAVAIWEFQDTTKTMTVPQTAYSAGSFEYKHYTSCHVATNSSVVATILARTRREDVVSGEFKSYSVPHSRAKGLLEGLQRILAASV